MSYFINFSLLKHNKNYRNLYLGQFVSFFGSMITMVALPYQIYHQTNSILLVGLIGLFQLVPILFTALIGGVLADRHHRKMLLIMAESLLALGCLLLAFNASSADPKVWSVFAIAVFMSAINGLHRPALESITQQVVTKKDFPLVSSLSSFTFSTCMIAGPAIGGLIIAHFGLVVTFIVDFLSFLISLTALSLIKDIKKPLSKKDQSTFSALISGVRYAASRQELLGTYFVDFIAMIFGMPMALFPAIAQSYGGAKVLGMLYSAPAVGALIVSFLSGWTMQVRQYGKAIAIAAGLWGIAIIFFGLSTNIWIALFFLSISGALDAISGIFRKTMWNLTIPSEYRGRLAGIEMISYMSGPKLGDTEAGLVAAAFGISTSVISGGILCVIGVAVCCYCLPKFWNYHLKK